MPGGPVRVIVLGSTGSIGVQTLEVIRALNAHAGGPRFRVVALAAGRNGSLLAQQEAELGVGRAVLAVRDGAQAVTQLVRQIPCDLLVAAIVGAAGLEPTLAALERGTPVALANKEALVAAGHLMIRPGRGAALLPIDSEHSAVWQCLGGARLPARAAFRRVLLTASGGPFRSLSAQQAFSMTPEAALRHPRWSMGRKITIDSATMVNKAFEMIEARWLFGLTSDRIGVLIHPQSVVHSLIEHEDGSLLAQLGSPDMKGPIGYALLADRDGRQRRDAGARRLSFSQAMSLHFEPACEERWEALTLARRVIDASFQRENSALGAAFNAANEVAVEAFLAGALPFGCITGVCRRVMDAMADATAASLTDVLGVDAEARRRALELAGRAAPAPGGPR